jgi:tetratricopeptide (TPR) repeat protein
MTEFFMTRKEDQLVSGIDKVRKEAGGFDIEKVEKYIEAKPDEVLGYVAKAVILGGMKRYEEAQKFLTQTQSKFSANGLLHHARATIYERQGKRAEAINESREAVRLNPYSPEIILTFGTLLNRAGRYDEAKEVWKDILKIDPKVAPAWNSLAKTEFETGDYKAAIDHSTAAIMLAEGTPLKYRFLQNRSQIRLANSDLEGALEDDAEILNNDVNEGVKHIFAQPNFLMSRGKPRLAAQYQQRALQRFPILLSLLQGGRE